MLLISISRRVRAMRTAISPRFAIRTRANGRWRLSLRTDTKRLQRDVAVLLGGQGRTLALQPAQPGGKPGARPRRHDHFVDISARRGDVRVGESLLILAHEPLSLGR